MSNFAFSDVMLVTNGDMQGLSFDSIGDPPVQQRPRIHWQRRHLPVFYDPSARAKAGFKLALRSILMSFGISVFPLFDSESLANTKGLKITIFFYLHRKKDDYRLVLGEKVLKETCDRFPKKKDVDNMLKFVMDALHGVLYDNDNVITFVVAVKEFVPESGREGAAHMEIAVEKRF
jgi:Holliday junction resolvase RusA-like endonuclease